MRQIENIIRRIVGKRLTAAFGTFHIYKRRASAEPIAIWLDFNGLIYRFTGAPNGWHLFVDDSSAKEVDMGESGAIRVRDLSAMPIFAGVMGQLARKVWLVESTVPKGVIGVRIDFDASTVRILNWGDELYVGDALPRDASPSEIAECLIEL